MRKNIRFQSSPFVPVYNIEDYLMVDRENKKAWDVFQLWKRDPNVRPIIIPSLFNAAFVPTNEGNYLILNRLAEHPRGKKLKDKMGHLEAEVMDLIIPPHEAGHNLQHAEEPKSSSLNTAFIKIYLAEIIIRPILPILTKITRMLGGEKILARVKERVVEMERNAHAFALSVYRTLDKKGLGVMSRMPSAALMKVQEFALKSYDKGLAFLKGPSASDEFRKRERMKKKTNPLGAPVPAHFAPAYGSPYSS